MAEIKTYIINDKWTDLNAENNVAVMSVDGEIDKVYVNGEEAGGGGGDFSTAEVTIVGSSTGTVEYEYSIPVVEAESPIYLMTPIASDDDQKITVPLHKGMLAFNAPEGVIVSGSATYDSETYTVLVTGTCSIKGFEIM